VFPVPRNTFRRSWLGYRAARGRRPGCAKASAAPANQTPFRQLRASGPGGAPQPLLPFARNSAKNRCAVVTEAGSYLRRIDLCITQLKAQGPSRTCNESKEEEKKNSAKMPRGDRRSASMVFDRSPQGQVIYQVAGEKCKGTSRCRANSAQIRQSRPDSGLGLSHFLAKVFKLFPLRSAADLCSQAQTGAWPRR